MSLRKYKKKAEEYKCPVCEALEGEVCQDLEDEEEKKEGFHTERYFLFLEKEYDKANLCNSCGSIAPANRDLCIICSGNFYR